MPSLNTGNAILSNPIKVDSSYNVGIGGAASGSYKLQVTGTANFTSDVFGLTGFYTRNSADTFIGSTNNTSGIIVNGTTLVTKIVSGGNTVATFANAGAATFSSSVTATEIGSSFGIYVARNGSNTQGSGPYLLLSNAAFSQLWYQQLNASNGLDFWYNGTKPLTIATNGAATFSSANQALGGLYSTTGNVLISTTDSFAINKGGSLSLGGKYNTAGAPIETFARIHGKKENSNDGDTAGYLAFETVPDATALLTERMRISSTGVVTIKGNEGTLIQQAATAGSEVFYQWWNSAGARRGYIGYGGTPTTNLDLWNAENGAIQFGTNNSLKMTIAANGSIGAPSGTNIYNASDLRLKRNVTTITNGLDKINALNPVKFNWIDGFEPSENEKDLLGFIAQEVQNVIPEAVEGFNSGNTINLNDIIIENPLRVNEKFIIPVLVKAIQELNQTVQNQQQQINSLINR